MAVLEKIDGPTDDSVAKVEVVAKRVAALSTAHERLVSEAAIQEHIDLMKSNPALRESIEAGTLDPRQIAVAVLRETVRLTHVQYKQTVGISPTVES